MPPSNSDTLPFTVDQIAVVTKACCDYEPAADGELAQQILQALAATMDRDCQYRGMYGPLRAWRLAGPWQKVDPQ